MSQKLTCIISLVLRKKTYSRKLGPITYSTGWIKHKRKKKLPKGDECTEHLKFICYCLDCKSVVYLWKIKQQNIFIFMKQIQIILLSQLIVYIRVTIVNVFLFKNSNIPTWKLGDWPWLGFSDHQTAHVPLSPCPLCACLLPFPITSGFPASRPPHTGGRPAPSYPV